MAVLSIEDLDVSLTRGDAMRPILDGVSLFVDEGETVGLVGESGSGKSVTCRAVLRLLPHDARISGRIRVGDDEVLGADQATLRRLRAFEAAMVFQDPRASINPMRRIGDFLTESLRANGIDARAAEARAVELLETVGIRDPRGALPRYPHEFSGGMLQRVMVAAALAPRPKVLLADEPTTALDVTTQAEVVSILSRLQRERGTALLFVTHDLELAAAICDRIYVMYAGRIVEMQSTDRLFARPLHPYTAALLRATPRLAPGAEQCVPIAGRPVSLDEAPPGCAFYDRCPIREPRCRQRPPALIQRDGHALVDCVHAEEKALA
jgi:peptide/nickel transport system ATP-binding protein